MQPWCSSLDRNIYKGFESSDQVFSLSATKGVLPPACHNYRTLQPARNKQHEIFSNASVNIAAKANSFP
jgi:hypothetical protein